MGKLTISMAIFNTLWWTNIAIENGPVEIVDFPINSMVIFHCYFSLPEGSYFDITRLGMSWNFSMRSRHLHGIGLVRAHLRLAGETPSEGVLHGNLGACQGGAGPKTPTYGDLVKSHGTLVSQPERKCWVNEK